MIQLNIHDEPILLCKRNIPIAKIVGLKSKSTKKRAIGLAKGDFVVPDDFFDPLPDEMLAAFEGH